MIDGSGQYETFSGVDRIRQDLTLALCEIYGANRFHPQWGSVLASYVGNPINSNLQQLVQAEVNRVMQNYITLQQNSVLRNTTYDITGVYDTSDVIRSVSGIAVTTTYDTIYVTASVTTQDRQTVTVTQQVGVS